MKKYTLTNETKIYNGQTLYRIVSLKNFRNVKVGDLGGFIQSEHNLSHSHNCWIYDNAIVMNDALVYGNAQVCDDSVVCDTAQVCEDSQVWGTAIIDGDAQVSDDAIII